MVAGVAAYGTGQRFPDVYPEDRYYADIEEVASRGWFVGRPNGSYSPNASITGEQIARVLEERVYHRKLSRAEFAAFLIGGYNRVETVRSSNSFGGSGEGVFTTVELESGAYRMEGKITTRPWNGCGRSYCPSRLVSVKLVNMTNPNRIRDLYIWNGRLAHDEGGYRTIKENYRNVQQGTYQIWVDDDEDTGSTFDWEFTLIRLGSY